MLWERQTAAVHLSLSLSLSHNIIYLVFLQDFKESPVSSHRPPVSVSSCPLLRLHTISQFNSRSEPCLLFSSVSCSLLPENGAHFLQSQKAIRHVNV